LSGKKLKLFIDASVFIAASASEEGGSAALFKICQKTPFLLVTTQIVLNESELNIKAKLDEEALLNFYKLIAQTQLVLQPTPASAERIKYHDIIHQKDAHVLAAAIEGDCDCLITLDRRHFMTAKIEEAKLPIKILTPGDFLKSL